MDKYGQISKMNHMIMVKEVAYTRNTSNKLKLHGLSYGKRFLTELDMLTYGSIMIIYKVIKLMVNHYIKMNKNNSPKFLMEINTINGKCIKIFMVKKVVKIW